MRILQVKVKPNAKVSKLEVLDEGTWQAWVKAPPVEGKANQELIQLIAHHFKVRKSDVIIKSGGSGRFKQVQIFD